MKITSMMCRALPALLLWAGISLAQVPANAVWIDVRTSGEFTQGHLQGAQHIPFDGIEVGVARLKLPKDTPIYLYCAVGGRAEVARERLARQNYRNVTNVGSLEAARALAAQGDTNGPQDAAR